MGMRRSRWRRGTRWCSLCSFRLPFTHGSFCRLSHGRRVKLTLPALEVNLLAIGDRDADNSNPRADVAVTTDEPDPLPPHDEREPIRTDTAPLDASEPAAAFDPSDVLESLGESLAPTLPAAPGGASAESTVGADSAAAATVQEPSDGLGITRARVAHRISEPGHVADHHHCRD